MKKEKTTHLDDLIKAPEQNVKGRKDESINDTEDEDLTGDNSLGSAFIYVTCAGCKGSVLEDLTRALWFLNHYLGCLRDQPENSDDWTRTKAFGEILSFITAAFHSQKPKPLIVSAALRLNQHIQTMLEKESQP